jgi:hypothetical protein
MGEAMPSLLDIEARRYKRHMTQMSAAVKVEHSSHEPETAAWRTAVLRTLDEVKGSLCLSLILAESLSLCGYRHGWQAWVSLVGVPIWFGLRKLRAL